LFSVKNWEKVFIFLYQEFISYYSLVTARHVILLVVLLGATCSKNLMHRRFKSDRDEILQECSSPKQTFRLTLLNFDLAS